MIGANMARVESLKPIAKQIANMTGKKIKICKFSTREVLEIIET
jgi:dihydroorotase-like cyclic amidohydrolase